METWEIIRAIDELNDWQDVHEIYEHCFSELNNAGQFEKIRGFNRGRKE
jgi:hypothetical protein